MVSCSIKESRSECPGYLTVNVPDDSRVITPVGMVAWDGEKELFRHSHDTAVDGFSWLKTLKRGDFTFLAYTGVVNSIDYENRIIIPVGQQCDSLYAYHEAVSLEEEYTVDVSLKKQFATVHLDLLQHHVGLAALTLQITSNTSGFDIVDFSPIEGPYLYSFQTDGTERIASFRVPRQMDDSMLFTVIAPDGRPLTEIALGEKIAQQMYDWTTEELQDVFVTVDFQYGVYTISIGDWEDGVTYMLIQN